MKTPDADLTGKRLAFVSTGIGVVAPLTEIARELNDKVEIYNIVDDSIIRAIAHDGNKLSPLVLRRVVGYCQLASDIGVDAILITCSSISEAVDVARPLVGVPVFKIDAPMAQMAVSMATKTVGVAATLQTTLEPTIRLIQSTARTMGRQITVKSTLCEGAFDALQNGDPGAHDALVRTGVDELLQGTDIVVLAQASMARAVEHFEDTGGRVLTSPRSGIGRVMEYLASGTTDAA